MSPAARRAFRRDPDGSCWVVRSYPLTPTAARVLPSVLVQLGPLAAQDATADGHRQAPDRPHRFEIVHTALGATVSVHVPVTVHHAKAAA